MRDRGNGATAERVLYEGIAEAGLSSVVDTIELIGRACLQVSYCASIVPKCERVTERVGSRDRGTAVKRCGSCMMSDISIDIIKAPS